MISRAEFDAYNAAVEEIAAGAESDVRNAVLAWCRENPDAAVAEKREAAKLIMEGVVQSYDEMAASLAADWYDYRAEYEGARLEKAITATVYDPDSIDRVARYQAGKLLSGDDAGFADACGEFARNDAMRGLNETVVANVERDRGRGVRFARIPTGYETCTFCIMLASRGAVYTSREAAGEFKHYHRRCDCKVVPGHSDDRFAELVEGVRPNELYSLWKEMESIDGDHAIDNAHKLALKQRRVNLYRARSNPSKAYRAENLDLSRLWPGELKRMQKKNPLEWESYVEISKMGYDQILLHEQGGASANIDVLLRLNGEWLYWDVKTIEGGAHAIKKRMGECYSKWTRLTEDGAVIPDDVDISKIDSPRAIVDNRYSKITDAEAARQIEESMAYLSEKGEFEFAQAMLIRKDGAVNVFGK